MNINTFTTSLACAALALLSSWNGNYGVDASVSFNDVVTCLADAPTICVGTSFGQGPSPAYDEATNTTIYIGGWKFTYDFMEGLETYNGTEFGKITDDDVLAEANATTLEVSVTIDDDGSCVIDVGSDDTCASCSTELCGFDDIWPNGDSYLPLSVTFDCTNVVNGRASLPEVCESVELSDGIFYPLVASMSKEEDTDAAALDGIVVDGGSSSTSSNGDASTSSSTTSTSTTAASSTSTSTCGLLEEGTFPQDGFDCAAAMPAEQTTIWCDMSRSFTSDAVDSTVTEMDKSCTCDLSDPKWKCSTSTHDSSSSSMSKEDNNDEAAAADVLVVDDSNNADASSTTTTTSTTSTCGLLPAGTLPEKDADCSAALPEGTATIWCEDLSYAGAGDTQTDTSCTCDRTNPIWKCTATDAALAPNQPCPPADTPKATGNSCTGQLSQPNSSMTCMWSRSQPVSSTSDAMEVSTISCECKRDADGIMERNEVWVCDGTFPPMPIVSPSKENSDKDLDSIADVGTMAAATTASSGNSATVHYVAVMAVGVVGAVFTMTTL